MTGPMRAPRATEHIRERTVGAEATEAVREAAREVETGSLGETVAGAGAVALGVLGIIGLLPGVLASVAGIAAGFSVLVGSAALGARATRLVGERVKSNREIGSGLGLAAMAGLAGIVLGILALLDVSRLELLSIAPIVLGAGLLIGSAAMARFEQFVRIERGTEAVYVASGADVLVGAGAIVLGILALSGVAPMTLSLIGILAVGAAALMSGTSVAWQVLGFMH
jgi:hypothetical protein